MAETGTLKIYQNRPGPVQGKCCLENMENFCLTLFWYSPTKYKYQAAKIPAIFHFDHKCQKSEMTVDCVDSFIYSCRICKIAIFGFLSIYRKFMFFR